MVIHILYQWKVDYSSIESRTQIVNEMIKSLQEIEAILDQIIGITNNQGTILLSEHQDNQEENKSIDLIDTMIQYKSELMNELEKREVLFQSQYNSAKSQLENSALLVTIKKMVTDILRKKEEIVEQEKRNLLILQSNVRKHEVTKLPKQPQAAIEAYKKTQQKT